MALTDIGDDVKLARITVIEQDPEEPSGDRPFPPLLWSLVPSLGSLPLANQGAQPLFPNLYPS